jgi:putative transposase
LSTVNTTTRKTRTVNCKRKFYQGNSAWACGSEICLRADVDDGQICKAPSDSIAIYAKNYKSKGIFYPTFFGKEPIKSAEEFPDKLEHDARLVRKRYGHFYLCIPKKLYKHNGPSQNKVIAFDPGLRTFCSGYDPDGMIVEVGKSDISKIYRLCNSYDKLKNKWS